MVKVVVNNLPYQDLEIMGLIPLADKGQPGGVAPLDEDGLVPAFMLPPVPLPTVDELREELSGTAASAITDHKAEAEPHPQYLLQEELDIHAFNSSNPHQVRADQIGAVSEFDPRLSDARPPLPHSHEDLLDRIFILESRPPSTSFSLSINCGRGYGNPIFDDPHYWMRDSYVSGGGTADNGVTDTTNTTIPWLYRDERFGTSTWTIPVVDGNYQVRLLFAENYYTAIGQRTFNVEIQGSTVLTNFDIFAEAGGGRIALIKSFPNVASINKQIIIKVFDPGTIMGIQLIK